MFAALSGPLAVSGGSVVEEAGNLTITKSFDDKIPVTSYRITARGRKALERYRGAMLQGLSRGAP